MKRREFLRDMAVLGSAMAVPSAAAGSPHDPKAEPSDGFEVLCFKYAGPFSSSGALLTYMRDWDKTVQRNFYFWALRGAKEFVLVDCGIRPAGRPTQDGQLCQPGRTCWPGSASRPPMCATWCSTTRISTTWAAWPFSQRDRVRPAPGIRLLGLRPMAKRPPFASLADPVSLAQLADLRDFPPAPGGRRPGDPARGGAPVHSRPHPGIAVRGRAPRPGEPWCSPRTAPTCTAISRWTCRAPDHGPAGHADQFHQAARQGGRRSCAAVPRARREAAHGVPADRAGRHRLA